MTHIVLGASIYRIGTDSMPSKNSEVESNKIFIWFGIKDCHDIKNCDHHYHQQHTRLQLTWTIKQLGKLKLFTTGNIFPSKSISDGTNSSFARESNMPRFSDTREDGEEGAEWVIRPRQDGEHIESSIKGNDGGEKETSRKRTIQYNLWKLCPGGKSVWGKVNPQF